MSSIGVVESWFPKSVYFKDGLFTNELNEWSSILENKIKDVDVNYSGPFSIKTNYPHARVLEEIPQLHKLKDEIFFQAYHYMKLLGFTGNLSLGHSWVNISSEGDYMFPHVHPECFFGGAFYLKASSTDFLTFYELHDGFPEPDYLTEMSVRHVDYACNPGRLLLFKNNLWHGYPKQTSRQEKITISFNLRREKK